MIKKVTLSPSSCHHPLSDIGFGPRLDKPIEADRDGDWQTVMSDPGFNFEIACGEDKGAGSSLADVSDVSEDDGFDADAYSIDGFRNSRPPTRRYTTASFPRNRGNTSKAKNGDMVDVVFLRHGRQNDHYKSLEATSRAATATSNFSARLSLDRSRPQRPKQIDLCKPILSYDTLDGETDQFISNIGQQMSPNFAGRADIPPAEAEWSHQRPVADVGDEIRTTFHQGIYPTNPDCPKYFPTCNTTLTDSNLPRLPFPLISLPEAAMLQQVRRERGEEDHTEQGSTFAAKARSCTASTISSSNGPLTPASVLGDASDILLPRPPRVFRCGPLRSEVSCK